MPGDGGLGFGVARAALLLDAFEGRERMTLTQVVRRTGLPRSSAHRLLERLVQLRWLRRGAGGYELGMRLFELGSLAQHQDSLYQAALPHLHELHNATGHVVHLAVLDGCDAVYLEKVGVGLAARLPSRTGWRHPALRTSVGKALLAHLPPDQVDAVFARERERRTITGSVDERRLRAELSWIRDRMVSLDREETVTGIGCVGAPVGDPGRMVAAVSVCGPIEDMVGHRLARPLHAAAQGIRRQYQAYGPSRIGSW